MSDARDPEMSPAEGASLDADDALASVMNVESDAEDALADDPEPAEDGGERDPDAVLRMDPSIEYREPADEGRRTPRDQI